MIFESRLISEIIKRIQDDLNAKHRELGSGALLAGDDPATIGLRFAVKTGAIQGLKAALVHIEEAERHLAIKPKTD